MGPTKQSLSLLGGVCVIRCSAVRKTSFLSGSLATDKQLISIDEEPGLGIETLKNNLSVCLRLVYIVKYTN